MILIGMYDSPFVRRVAVALRFYEMSYEHRPWSVFTDAAEIARLNPLIRVPVLVLDDGTSLMESGAILDYLDQQVDPTKVLIAQAGDARRDALRGMALATGLAEKAVSLVYEQVLHDPVSPAWSMRCTGQIMAVLDVLEAELRCRANPYWFGDAIGHADIVLACAHRFTFEAHPALRDVGRWPTLAWHAAGCEALEPFRAVTQCFSPPSR